MGETKQGFSKRSSTFQKPKMTKEERRAKYTAIARKRREKQRERQIGNSRRFGHKEIVCFQCRKPGHTVANCPLNGGAGAQERCTQVLCYKCGSTEHSLSECKIRSNELPYAKCFICEEMGHLASQCPKNNRGIYVNGGSCRYCGSTDHLQTDCPSKEKKRQKVCPVGEATVDELLEKPKEIRASVAPPSKRKKKRVVKF